MEITATAKFIRVSPRKMELLVRGIKKFSPQTAVDTLKFTNKSGSVPLLKVIASALNNAKQAAIDTGDVRFKEIHVLPGGAMKRFRAVSRGMAHEYKKRMTHVTVILTQVEKPKVKSIQPALQEKTVVTESKPVVATPKVKTVKKQKEKTP